MTMTREDMLRELELLPVWTLNPAFAERQIATQTDAIERSQPEPIQPISEVAAVTAMETPEPPIVQASIKAKKAIAWLLYCPLDNGIDQDALTLLHNMVRAMQLVSTDYQIVHEAVASHAFQPERTLIFGVETAKALLNVDVKLEDISQQPYEHLQRPCWVVHHPKMLLENPALKREAWQIMCAAKAFMQQSNTST